MEHEPPPGPRRSHALAKRGAAERVEDEQPIDAAGDRLGNVDLCRNLDQLAGRRLQRRRRDPQRRRLHHDRRVFLVGRPRRHSQASLAGGGLGERDLEPRDDVRLLSGEVPPAAPREVLDAFHAAAAQELGPLHDRGAGRHEMPLFGERGVRRRERAGHHRAFGLHAVLPDTSLELAGDRRRPPKPHDRRGRVGDDE